MQLNTAQLEQEFLQDEMFEQALRPPDPEFKPSHAPMQRLQYGAVIPEKCPFCGAGVYYGQDYKYGTIEVHCMATWSQVAEIAPQLKVVPLEGITGHVMPIQMIKSICIDCEKEYEKRPTTKSPRCNRCKNIANGKKHRAKIKGVGR